MKYSKKSQISIFNSNAFFVSLNFQFQSFLSHNTVSILNQTSTKTFTQRLSDMVQFRFQSTVALLATALFAKRTSAQLTTSKIPVSGTGKPWLIFYLSQSQNLSLY